MHQRRPTKTKENNDEDVIDVARIKQLQALAAAAQPQYGVKEVTEEAWLLTKLAFLLLRFLMGSYKWIVRVARLSAFVLLLCPALLLMAYRYFKSSNIIRDVRYGPYARNFLDIYIPPNRAGRKKGTGYPVAIFFTGGAWTIGYKLWSSLFSDVFMEEGVLYATPDYRNFPQGYGNDMAEDVERAISWVLQNIALYGGDPENVTVVGQSAGAHLSSFVLVRKAAEELEAKLRGESEAQRRKAEAASRGDDETTDNRNGDDENGGGKSTFVQPMREAREAHARDELEAGTGEAKWSVAQIRKYIGVAGPYDLAGYVGYLHSRGLPSYMLYSIFQGELSRYSPTRIAQDLLRKYRLVDAAAAGGRRITLPFPPTVLVHGTADVTMPAKASEEFGKALQDLGVQVEVKLHRDKTHTDCIMEDIFLGDNVMLNDIVKAVTTVEQVLRRQEQEQEQEVGNDEKSSAQAGDLVDNKKQEEKEEEREGQGRSEIGEVAAKAVAAVEQKWRRLAPSYYPAFLVRTAQRVNPF